LIESLLPRFFYTTLHQYSRKNNRSRQASL